MVIIAKVKTMNNLIKKALENFDNDIFCMYNDLSLTYRDIAVFCKKVEHMVAENQVVYSFLDRSVESVLSLISTFYTNNVFCPISLQWNEEKILNMLTTFGGKYLFVSESTLGVIENIIEKNELQMTIFVILGTNIKVIHKGAENYESIIPPNVGYIYSTSGSTGPSKCVLGRRDSLKRFLQWEINAFCIDNKRIFCNVTKPTFDPYLRDILVPFVVGAKIYIPNVSVVLNTFALRERIIETGVTDIHLVPSMFRKINLIGTSVKNVYLAGEVLYGNDIVNYTKEDIKIVNLYGPTETTLAKFFHICDEHDIGKNILPVGKPIDDSIYYIKDGEIVIETKWGSEGYFNYESDDFVSLDDNMIRYFTKDKGYIDENGNLIVLGRVNDSTKLLGEKIDIGAMAESILECECIKECFIVGVNNGTRSYLLVSIGSPISASDVRLAALDKLKKDDIKIVPMKFYVVEELPKNENGKIDRRRILQAHMKSSLGDK